MICPKCQSDSLSIIPAEVRLYRNSLRTLSHPPMTPSPDVRVCLDCGWSEFSIPRSWLAAGWLRSLRPQQPVQVNSPVAAVNAPAAAS
jgi:hypothetical protein